MRVIACHGSLIHQQSPSPPLHLKHGASLSRKQWVAMPTLGLPWRQAIYVIRESLTGHARLRADKESGQRCDGLCGALERGGGEEEVVELFFFNRESVFIPFLMK